MKTIRSPFQIFIGRVTSYVLLLLLWALGILVGSFGGGYLSHTIFTDTDSIWLILFRVIQIPVSIWFFIALGRQILPGGIKEFSSGENFLTNRARYFPGVFSLGVFAGLALVQILYFVLFR